MTPETFDALFSSFRHTVARLETLPAYDVGGQEAVRIKAFREGKPRPERSVRTDPWLARIATSTATERKSWRRVRVVDEPLTEYQRYQFLGYGESQAVGEQVSVVTRSKVGDVGPDFWLYDAGTDNAHAVVMAYDDAGHWLGAELVNDVAVVNELAARLEEVARHAVPFNSYLAGLSRG